MGKGKDAKEGLFACCAVCGKNPLKHSEKLYTQKDTPTLHLYQRISFPLCKHAAILKTVKMTIFRRKKKKDNSFISAQKWIVGRR